MTSFAPLKVDSIAEADVRAQARSKMFFALRKAFKARSVSCRHLGKELADAVDKDPAFISRVLNGTNKTMDFETLALLLSGLGYNVDLDIKSYEELCARRSNVDARPRQPVIRRARPAYSNDVVRSNSNVRNGGHPAMADM